MVIRKRLNIKTPALVFVTSTIANWRPLFNNSELANIAAKQLDETCRFFGVSTIGYVIMPSHIHALLGFPDLTRLSKFMQSYKSISSRRFKEVMDKEILAQYTINGHFRIWKPRFDDIVIYSEEQFLIKLNYIHNNPVKAGLTTKSINWKFSSAIDWHSEKPGLIKIDKNYKWLHQE